MKRFTVLAAAALAAAALLLRAVHLGWGLPEVFEEATPVREAIQLWGTPGGQIDLNPHFFKYPSLTFYLQFLLQVFWYLWASLSGAVTSLNDFRQLLTDSFPQTVLLGRWLQAVLGALLVVPTYLLGRGLAGRGAGWAGAAMAALLPTAVIESQLVSPDVALTLFSAAALVAATRIVETGSRNAYLWCGLWIGLAAAAKYPGVLLVASLWTAHAVRSVEARRGPGHLLFSGLPWQALFTAACAFAIASPFVLLDAGTAFEDIVFERHHMELGHLGREEGRAWLYYLAREIPGGWTPVVAGLALAGGIGLLARPRSRRLALPGAVFLVLSLLVLGSWRMAAPRYILPLVPLGAVWAGSAVAGLAAGLVPRGRNRAGAAALLTVLVLVWPAITVTREIGQRGRPDSRLAALSWIEENVSEASAILVERYGPEPDPDRHHVLYLPFHGVTPHLYDPAYSPPLYATFDVVVLSAGVSARYLARPREYPAQVAFYRDMETGFREVASFSAGEHLGPEIRILRRREDAVLKTVADIPAHYFRSLKGDAAMAEYLSALGTVLVRQGETEHGFFVLREAVEMDAENAKVWGNLGAMNLRVGRFEDALNTFRRARELDAGNAEIALNLATLYGRMGELRQAADSYQEALQLKPELETAYIGLARVLVEDDRFGQARAVLRQFLERFPRSPHREAAETALEELARMGPGKP